MDTFLTPTTLLSADAPPPPLFSKYTLMFSQLIIGTPTRRRKLRDHLVHVQLQLRSEHKLAYAWVKMGYSRRATATESSGKSDPKLTTTQSRLPFVCKLYIYVSSMNCRYVATIYVISFLLAANSHYVYLMWYIFLRAMQTVKMFLHSWTSLFPSEARQLTCL